MGASIGTLSFTQDGVALNAHPLALAGAANGAFCAAAAVVRRFQIIEPKVSPMALVVVGTSGFPYEKRVAKPLFVRGYELPFYDSPVCCSSHVPMYIK
jgi:hypothetical protein